MTSPNEQEAIPFESPAQDESQDFAIWNVSAGTIPPLEDMVYHRHDYQTIVWTTAGEATHSIDGEEITTMAPSILLIAKGQIHKLISMRHDCAGIRVLFRDAFLPNTASQGWNYLATLFNNLSPAQPLSVPVEDIPRIERLFEQLRDESEQRDSFGQTEALQHLLQILLLKIERIYRAALVRDDTAAANYERYQRFLTLLEASFTTHHNVAHYAAELRMSPRQLSDLSSRVVGKTAKQSIVDRLVLEAKRHLQFTSWSVKQIAYALGYLSPYYFSQAFKKATNQSPSEYRKLL